MKKAFLLISLFFLILFLIPVLTNAVPAQEPLVPCNGPNCTIESFFIMLARIFNFIVWYIATPLAILSLTIGGVMILISAGNPQWLQTGKETIKWAIVGLVLVFCSWLIVNFILGALGYTKAWNVL